MGFEKLLTAEMITAFAVFVGALFGGVVAVVAEFRKPIKTDPPDGDGVEANGEPTLRDVVTCVQEETDHVNRTLWVIEKKLSEQLHRIEKELLAAGARER